MRLSILRTVKFGPKPAAPDPEPAPINCLKNMGNWLAWTKPFPGQATVAVAGVVLWSRPFFPSTTGTEWPSVT